MARGKYKKRSDRRNEQQTTQAERELRRRFEAELREHRQAERDALALDQVLEEIRVAHAELLRVTEAEQRELAEEIASLTSDLLEAQALSDTERRRRDRKMVSMSGGGWTEKESLAFWERMAVASGGYDPDVTVTSGVHRAKGLDTEAIRRIQQARGLR